MHDVELAMQRLSDATKGLVRLRGQIQEGNSAQVPTALLPGEMLVQTDPGGDVIMAGVEQRRVVKWDVTIFG